VFSWRKLSDGTVWIAAVSNADLYARGTVRRSCCIAVGMSVLFALIVAYFMARDVSTPVAILQARAERLASGDLRQISTFESEDELGDLARSFDGMVARCATTLLRVASSAGRARGARERARTGVPHALGRDDRTGAGHAARAESMEQIQRAGVGIAQSSSALNESIEESSSSISSSARRVRN